MGLSLGPASGSVAGERKGRGCLAGEQASSALMTGQRRAAPLPQVKRSRPRRITSKSAILYVAANLGSRLENGSLPGTLLRG